MTSAVRPQTDVMAITSLPWVAGARGMGRLEGMEPTEDRSHEPPGSIVYAVLLQPLDAFSPGDRKSVLAKNPQVGPKRKVYYVGQTSRPFSVRYQQHLDGIKAGRGWIRKYKSRPVPLDEGEADFGRGVPPAVRKQIARLAKRQMSDPRVREAKVAALLREQGFAVISS